MYALSHVSCSAATEQVLHKLTSCKHSLYACMRLFVMQQGWSLNDGQCPQIDIAKAKCVRNETWLGPAE